MSLYDPQQSLGFLLYEVSRLLRRNFDARVRHLSLTQAQWRTIVYMAKNEGCKQATLADFLEIRPITLTRLLDRLQSSGWIERRPDPDDRRVTRLYLTESAKPLLETLWGKAMASRKQALQGISPEQQAALFDALKKMKNNLSAEERPTSEPGRE